MIVSLARNQNGFTTVELLVSLVFFTIIFALVTVNLTGLIPNENLDQSVLSFISEVRKQQLKAMAGDAESTAVTSEYGVFLGSDHYSLFKGSTYNPSDTNNIRVELPSNIRFSVSTAIPAQTILFQALNGEVALVATSSAEILLTDSILQQSKVVKINTLGVVYVETD